LFLSSSRSIVIIVGVLLFVAVVAVLLGAAALAVAPAAVVAVQPHCPMLAISHVRCRVCRTNATNSEHVNAFHGSDKHLSEKLHHMHVMHASSDFDYVF
jgi:hypothetical protein